MHASLKTVLSNIAGLVEQTRRDLTAISNDQAAKEYGPRYIAGQRIKRLTDAQKAGQAALNGFLEDQWPAVQQQRKTQAAAVSSSLKDGPRVTWRTDFSEDEWKVLGVTSMEARKVYLQGERMRGEILQAMSEDHRLTAEGHALNMRNMLPTTAIEALINGYREGAKGDLAGFDRASWRADRAVLPLLLARRAALPKLTAEEIKTGKLDNPDRAAMLLESNFVSEIENSVVQQTVAPDPDSEFFIERTQDALDNMVATDGGVPVENLQLAETWFGQVERRIAREDGTPMSMGPAPVEPAPPAKPASIPVTAPVAGLAPGSYSIR